MSSNETFTQEDLRHVGDVISSVGMNLISLQQLAVQVGDGVDPHAFADVADVVIQNSVRILDACTRRLGGAPNGNFDEVFHGHGT